MIAKETTVTFFVEAHHSMHTRGTMSTKDVTIDLSCALNRRYDLLHHSVCSLSAILVEINAFTGEAMKTISAVFEVQQFQVIG